jgi:hypothetical protein
VVPGAAALGAEAVLQWWASGRNYAKYSPEGANPVAIIKVRFFMTCAWSAHSTWHTNSHCASGSIGRCWLPSETSEHTLAGT